MRNNSLKNQLGLLSIAILFLAMGATLAGVSERQNTEKKAVGGTGGDLRPTPTTAPGPALSLLRFKVSFEGIDHKINDQHATLSIRQGETVHVTEADISFDNSGVGTGVAEVWLFPSDRYYVSVKGPQHLWGEFCADNQTWVCGKDDLGIFLPSETVFDWSKIRLLPGDLPDMDNQQDGFIDCGDLYRLKRQMGRTGNNLIGDLDYNGVVNGGDLSLFLKVMKNNY